MTTEPFQDRLQAIRDIASAIAAGDRRYCELLDALPAAVYITDAQGHITFYNQACIAFAGRRPRLGDRWCVTSKLCWPDGTPMRQDECPMAVALREDRPVRGAEAIGERPDGTRVDFMPYPTPLHDSSGKLVGAVNMLVDITERKRAEQAMVQANATLERRIAERTHTLVETLEKLRESERRFRLLVDGVVDCAIFMLDQDGTVSSWNPGAARIKGYQSDEIIGQHFSVFYTPEDRAAGIPQRALGIAMRQGKYESEGWRVRSDGTQFWASVVLDALYDETGALIGFAKVTRDFTERRKSEQALIESERTARAIISTALDAFIQLDERGIVHEWSPQAESTFGWTSEDAIGRHYSELILPSEDRARHPNGVAGLLHGASNPERGARLQIGAMRRDGRRLPLEIAMSAVHRDEGVIYNVFAHDLTEKLAAEAQLRQAQKMEAIGQLTGGIAHDFNNLLAAIVPNLELAKLRVADPRTLKHLDDALHAADRGAALTRRLLAFARKQELVISAVDLHRLISGICDMLPRTLGPKVRVEANIAPDLWLAMTDAGQLELALLNLAINARDAMPNGGMLTFAGTNLPAGFDRKPERLGHADYVEIAVSDTGCGMDDNVLRHVFEPFFTTKETGKGSGLGLSMVYGFVEQSNGAISIDSVPGKGTTVRLYLPRAVAVTTGERVSVERENDAGSPARILVIDDDEAVRVATAGLIRGFGHEVVEAESGAAALAHLTQDGAFAVIVVDVAMPYMQGPAFAEKARHLTPNATILFVSGDLEVSLPAGAHLLGKPYNKAGLAAKLRELLAGTTATVLPFPQRPDAVA